MNHKFANLPQQDVIAHLKKTIAGLESGLFTMSYCGIEIDEEKPRMLGPDARYGYTKADSRTVKWKLCIVERME